jgi:hypothetical protein
MQIRVEKERLRDEYQLGAQATDGCNDAMGYLGGVVWF